MPGYELFDHEERNAVNAIFDANGGVLFAHGFDAIRNGVFKVREFEKTASEMFHVPYAQAVSSCTAALRVALAAFDLGPEDEVIIPSFTFVATAEAVLAAGAKLVVVDIDESFTMDPAAFEAAITDKTAVVIPVHMMSAPADLDRICAIAKKHNVKVIEDAAWGVGATWQGKALGTIGDMGCYSFDAGKCISTGEGGMILTNNEELFKKVRAYHDHGHEYATNVSRGEEGAIGVGFNYRMTELQGAIGIVQLGKLNKIISMQKANKAKLKKLLTEGGFPFRFRTIHDEGEGGDALFFILNNREQTQAFLKRMKEEGLGTKNVPDAMRWHFAKHWSHMFNKAGVYHDTYETQWQKSADILESSIALPVMIKMTDDRIAEIAEKLLKISKEIA
ncbi:DegT/DnrJ/EryC1/StrS family aminotransferase [Sediminibacterium roseum]|uniref:DegT/DnrJ/EryC1/StrS family aminotransferase n=1 Tax=Sediminibacterium roseum TaxID=1978412 RepID=A0ABW9ZVK9_9BACT|nr:DegT/DnrJ/EryC1/StrS family aminotransferase [Sediminibacterium roseum]NCI49085.1 DegT/DnrJ/EryC1/StrS family aminotransferase [Sediminibacterium roseum]